MGVDLGTSNIKAVLFDENGQQVCIMSRENELLLPGSGMVECDPEQVFDCMMKTMKDCLDKVSDSREKLAGIGLSTHSHNIIALDKEGNCLTRAYTWADTRAAAQAREIDERFAGGRLYERTGCYIRHPLYPISKIKWMQKDPILWSKVKRLVGIKDYIIFRLYGQFIVDYTNASEHGIFNISELKWDSFILENVLNVSEEMLSMPVPCDFALHNMKKEYADYLGIEADIPFAIGSSDGMCANVGSGVFDETEASCTIGTTGAIRTASAKPRLDVKKRTWCYSLTDDRWVLGGATNNGGLALRWLRDTYAGQYQAKANEKGCSVYELFSSYAEEIPAGSDGLIFLPYFTGERNPDWNDKAKGMIYGLTLSHSDKHIIRAAMEGVLYRLYSVFLSMQELGCEIRTLKVNGGYARSDCWLKMQADLFDTDIEVMQVTEAAALGAAYMAMVASGGVGKMGDPLEAMKAGQVIHPRKEYHGMYLEFYKKAKTIYDRVYKGNE